MPRTKKETDALTNGHSPSEPIEQENLDSKMTPNADAEIEVTETIATRYYDCIEEIAPQIAREFWNRLDEAVKREIVAQRPSHRRPLFLSGIGERLTTMKETDLTTRAIASGGGLGG